MKPATGQNLAFDINQFSLYMLFDLFFQIRKNKDDPAVSKVKTRKKKKETSPSSFYTFSDERVNA